MFNLNNNIYWHLIIYVLHSATIVGSPIIFNNQPIIRIEPFQQNINRPADLR